MIHIFHEHALIADRYLHEHKNTEVHMFTSCWVTNVISILSKTVIHFQTISSRVGTKRRAVKFLYKFTK